MAQELASTVAAPVELERVIRKSRFITRLEPVSCVAEADAAIAAVRKHHHDADHHCVAMVVGADAGQQRSNDDGEPAGTAGVPMLEVLRRRNMTDVVAIVTRYFGGVLLGAGGLRRAYSSSVALALDAAPVLRRVVMVPMIVDAPLRSAGRLQHELRGVGIVEGVEYGTRARFSVLVAPDDLDNLEMVLSGEGASQMRGQPKVVGVPV